MTHVVKNSQGDDLVLTVDEARILLKIGRTAAYEAIRKGDIPSVRIGSRVLVPMARLRKMLDP